MKRPDLTGLPETVVSYITYLEAQIHGPQSDRPDNRPPISRTVPGVTRRTDLLLIAILPDGSLHVSEVDSIPAQRRGGSGQALLPSAAPLGGAAFGVVPQTGTLLLFSRSGKAFRLPVSKVTQNPATTIEEVLYPLALESGDRIAVILPEQTNGNLAFLSADGRVRLLRHHLFGTSMKQGFSVFGPESHISLADASWLDNEKEIFCLTRQGMSIRVPLAVIPPQGVQAIKVASEDEGCGICGIGDEETVLLVSTTGFGTVRNLQPYAAHKSAGGMGKIAMKSLPLLRCFATAQEEELLLLSHEGKIIRFHTTDIPITDNPVQGVICMNLRQDHLAGMALIRNE